MTVNHLPQAMLPIQLGPFELDFGFGLGVRVVTSLGEARSLSSAGEYGWAGAANTYYWIDPAEEMIGLMRHSICRYTPIRSRSVLRSWRIRRLMIKRRKKGMEDRG